VERARRRFGRWVVQFDDTTALYHTADDEAGSGAGDVNLTASAVPSRKPPDWLLLGAIGASGLGTSQASGRLTHSIPTLPAHVLVHGFFVHAEDADRLELPALSNLIESLCMRFAVNWWRTHPTRRQSCFDPLVRSGHFCWRLASVCVLWRQCLSENRKWFQPIDPAIFPRPADMVGWQRSLRDRAGYGDRGRG